MKYQILFSGENKKNKQLEKCPLDTNAPPGARMDRGKTHMHIYTKHPIIHTSCILSISSFY